MAVSRRTFLRVLGSAAVAAVVAPVAAEPLFNVGDTIDVFWGFRAQPAPPLTYDMLRAAYESCVIGRNEPTMMVVSSQTARAFGLVYDVEVDDV